MMADHTVLKKGSSRRMEATITSAWQARRISAALKALQNTPLEELERNGAVKKLRVEGRDDIFSFRVGSKERIIFSPAGKRIFIHDIVSLNNKSTVESLIEG